MRPSALVSLGNIYRVIVMKPKKDQTIDEILNQWPFDPMNVNVRMLQSRQRKILQMRIDMGILQMEIEGRPDGYNPYGATSYFDFLKKQSAKSDDGSFELDEEHCLEIDREFVQFYHRRVCWLQLKEFQRAVNDADHTLGLMDFCKLHSPDDEWTFSHERYRPFVIYHRTQAAALGFMADEEAVEQAQPEKAIEEINRGLATLKNLFIEHEAEDQFDEDELVVRLIEFQNSIRENYEVGQTLVERLDQAIADEDYEKAAALRDQLERSIESPPVGLTDATGSLEVDLPKNLERPSDSDSSDLGQDDDSSPRPDL